MKVNISLFPAFSPLDISHKEFIDNYLLGFPSYSAFNFTCLYSYGVGFIELSMLNNNLVVLAPDIVDGQVYFSFIGMNSINETISILLEESKRRGISDYIKLIPECVIKYIDGFSIKEDRDNSDYILLAESNFNLNGSKFRNKKNLLNRFMIAYPDVVCQRIDMTNSTDRIKIRKLFDIWINNKNTNDNCIVERDAVMELMNCNGLNNICEGFFVNSTLVAFFIYELIPDYLLMHFIKYNVNYTGVGAFVYKHLAQRAIDNNCRYINIEQDLGITGLRESKLQLHPVNYLKTYIVK